MTCQVAITRHWHTEASEHGWYVVYPDGRSAGPWPEQEASQHLARLRAAQPTLRAPGCTCPRP